MSSPGEVKVKVLFFASAREAAGNVNETEVSFPAHAQNADTSHLRKILAERYPRLAQTVLDEETVTLALNEEYVPSGQVLPLKSGDTVALIPPISGG